MLSQAEMLSCTSKCRSKQHADLLISAISKCRRGTNEAQFFCLSNCRNFACQKDSSGRHLVHWAAADGKVELLEWLIESVQCDFCSKVRYL